jgi:hypothetical protein
VSDVAINANKLETNSFQNLMSNFLHNYTEWLTSKFTSFAFLIMLFVYWYISIKGAIKIEAKLTPEKLFLHDSPILEVF